MRASFCWFLTQALYENLSAGHALNYISRSTHWGTEQRQQLDYTKGNRTGIVNQRWRNDCGIGGEDCSFCMVSVVALVAAVVVAAFGPVHQSFLYYKRKYL